MLTIVNGLFFVMNKKLFENSAEINILRDVPSVGELYTIQIIFFSHCKHVGVKTDNMGLVTDTEQIIEFDIKVC